MIRSLYHLNLTWLWEPRIEGVGRMRCWTRFAWLVAICLGSSLGLTPRGSGATIHLIVAADTLDAKIGKTVEVDARSITALFEKNVPAATRVLSITQLVGQRCNPDAIRAAIDRLTVQPDDAIVVFYQGHGAFDPQVGHYLKFPRLNDAFLTRSDLIARIKGHGVRLGVVATDCCNKLSILPGKWEIAFGLEAPPPAEPKVSPLFTALFLNAAGFVDLTSSKQGEESISYPAIRQEGGTETVRGGLFTSALVRLFAWNEKRPLTWQQVAEQVGKDVQAAFRTLKPDGLDNPDEPEKPQMTQTVVTLLAVEVIRQGDGGAEEPEPAPNPVHTYDVGQSLGIVGYENNGRGLAIHASRPGSAAARLGLEQGDVILAVNDNPIRTIQGYQRTLQQAKGAVRLVFQDVRTRQVKTTEVALDGNRSRILPFRPAPGAPPTFGVLGSPVAGGVRVDSTVPGSPSSLLQLDPGDVITAVNGAMIASMDQLTEAVHASPDEMWFDIINVRTGRPQAMLASLNRVANGLPDPGPIGGRNLTFGVHGYESGDGIKVYAVRPGSPAARLGFERGDVLLALNNRPLRTVADYRDALAASGDKLSVTFRDIRSGQQRTSWIPLEVGRGGGANGPAFGVLTAETPRGLVIQSVVPNSAAHFSGLDLGDVLVSINGVAVGSQADLDRTLRDSPDEMIYTVRNIRTGAVQGMVTRLDR